MLIRPVGQAPEPWGRRENSAKDELLTGEGCIPQFPSCFFSLRSVSWTGVHQDFGPTLKVTDTTTNCRTQFGIQNLVQRLFKKKTSFIHNNVIYKTGYCSFKIRNDCGTSLYFGPADLSSPSSEMSCPATVGHGISTDYRHGS